MNTKIVSLALLFLAFARADLITDAQTQVESLKSLVLGNIAVAQDELTGFYDDIVAYSTTVIADGRIAIDQVHAEVSDQLSQIKALAASANKDISYCTGGREQMINKLPTELKERIDTCIISQDTEAASILDSSIYIVDIIINKVNNLEFQLRSCGDSEICVSFIVTEIEKHTVDLPLQIKVEVDKASELIAKLRVIVRECGDNNVADFTGYVTDLVTQIATCANRIIGRG